MAVFGVARRVLRNDIRGVRRREALSVRLTALTSPRSRDGTDPDLIARRVDIAATCPRLSPTEQEAMLTTACWVLADEFTGWSPAAADDGDMVTATFDGSTFEVAVCDSRVSHPAQGDEGRLVVTGEAELSGANHGLACGPGKKLNGTYWSSLLLSRSYLGTDGRRPGHGCPSTTEGEVDPPAVDPDPATSMEWSRLNDDVVIESPCWQQLNASWGWEGATESRLIAVVSEGDGGDCPGQPGMATLTQMFMSVPEVQTDGTRLALRVRKPYAALVEVLTSGPPAIITDPQDQFTGATWPAGAVTGESFSGYRVSISPDGTWTGFLALD